MTWYAQHGEDRKIAELLQWDGRRQLFYIDVGAWHPEQDSVTKAFYDAGSRGINVEPLPEYFAMLSIMRPDDVNLDCAVDDVGGGHVATFNRVSTELGQAIAGSGLATFDADNAQNAIDRAHFHLNPIAVRCFTLAEICDQHVPSGKTIDFLKIDVEGWEEQVIRGMDWERWRPTVLCIEATRPSSTIPAWDWEPLVLAADYRFLTFDGLNRWYRNAR